MRVTDLDGEVMESFCQELRRTRPDGNIFILGNHDQEGQPLRVTSTKLVELRNPDANGELRQPLLVFIPTSLRTSAEDSFGVATFEELTFTGIYEDLIDSLLDRLPATLVGHARDLLGILSEEEWLFAEDVSRVRYLLTLAGSPAFCRLDSVNGSDASCHITKESRSMKEMTRSERIMAASRGQAADRLPFFHFWRHSQIGWAERDCRNRGMGMCWVRPCWVENMHGVEVSEKAIQREGQTVWKRTFSTPVGEVWVTERREPGTGQWHGQRSWNDVTPWQLERLIKRPEDYRVVQYMVENTEYVADYFPLEQAMDWLGDDGIVLTGLPHSPMQMLMIDWVGSEGGRFFFHHADHPELVEELYRALCRSRQPLYQIAARAPAPVVLCGDNIDGVLVTPKLFERYFMPVYEEQARVLHAHGKLMAVHMDGRLKALRELVARTPVDIVEAFHPPPMGDLPLAEALAWWPDKAIWVGFPGSVYALGAEATQRFALELLGQMGAGERLVLEMSTENLVSNENLLALTSVLEKAELPLTAEKVERIGRSLSG